MRQAHAVRLDLQHALLKGPEASLLDLRASLCSISEGGTPHLENLVLSVLYLL